MIKNYFVTAWRNLMRGKSFSFINIAGLATGMAGSLLILLWLQNETSFDSFHRNKDRLYQVYALAGGGDGHSVAVDETSQPLGPALLHDFPEIAGQARVKNTSAFLFTAGSKSLTGLSGSFVDPAFLTLFDFPLQQGDKASQLETVNSITITERLANKLFGTSAALGKIIRLDSADNFTVTGVLKDLPSNTRFDFDYLLPWDYLKRIGSNNDSWLSNNTLSFVLLQPKTNIDLINKKIAGISRARAGRNDIWTHFLFPLKQWHLYNAFENGQPAGGRIETIRTFAIIAAFILLIACINFMNLSTARSEQRAKEVGIRKVAGAGKGLLVTQFITEAFLTTCVACALALLLVQLALPAFNMLVQTQLSIAWNNIYFWLCLLAFVAVTSLLAGSYPAFYLSSFKPAGIFKKQYKKTNAAVSPRQVLVILQFTFAISLIISTMVIQRQLVYAQNRDKGYSSSRLIQVDFAGDIGRNYPLIKQDLLRGGIAASVTKTMAGMTDGGTHTWGLRWEGESPADTSTAVTLYSADADLVTTTGMQLLQGRDININQFPGDSFAVVLNEAAVKLMGFDNAVGRTIFHPSDGIQHHVVGVVKNYIAGSPYEAVPPTVIMGPGGWFNTIQIKLNTQTGTAASLEKAAAVFKRYNPAYPFDYKFADQQYAARFDNEQRIKTMAGLFALLAICISCLGLFGLSAYVAETRVKEIGVRKILGASVLTITRLLSVDFIRLVIVALLIAIPVSWWAMQRWLLNFDYRIQISWTTYLSAGALAILVALLTVSFQSVKAALSNPVKNLRMD